MGEDDFLESQYEDNNGGGLSDEDHDEQVQEDEDEDPERVASDADNARWQALKEAAGRDASLGVGHLWTRSQCPAYLTYDPALCTC